MTFKRTVLYFLITVFILYLGLATRSHPHWFPTFVAEYGGDTLWAALFLFPIRILFPRKPLAKLVVFCYAFAVAIEISQLYETPWLDKLRHTTFGHLVLGAGFLWSDILCYAAGVLASWTIVAIIEKYWLKD